MTIHRTERPDAPAVLILPGGGYAHHTQEGYAPWLTSIGLNAFEFRYPVTARHPRPADASALALEWIRSGEHGIPLDPTRVAVLGSSAGGHLAACLGVGIGEAIETGQTPRPDLLILSYPLISLTGATHHVSLENLLGATPSRAEREELSPDTRIDALTPPTFVWATADDAVVPATNALRFATAMIHAARPIELHLFPHGGHSLALASKEPHIAVWTDLARRWLIRHEWIQATGARRPGPTL